MELHVGSWGRVIEVGMFVIGLERAAYCWVLGSLSTLVEDRQVRVTARQGLRAEARCSVKRNHMQVSPCG